jgi:V8-like Glu-specific endopeptidase
MKGTMETIDWSNFSSSVLVEVTHRKEISLFSGVAVNPTTILTAAHCLKGEVTKIRVFIDSNYHQNGHFIEVKSFEIHPDVENGLDLGKIKLCGELPKETVFYPIIKKDHQLQGKIFRIGFGRRNKQNARTLLNPFFKSIIHLNKLLVLEDLYSFSGDSGGPVFLQNAGQIYLVAIHSKKTPRIKGKYSFNTLLSSHREWIVC